MSDWLHGLVDRQQASVGSLLRFLLLFRRAYMFRCAEGLDVLYRTNTILLGDGKLIEASLFSASSSPSPRRVLVPTNLMSVITKLELIWTWKLFAHPNGLKKQTLDRAHMASHLHLLPKAFPMLVTLYISYTDHLYGRREHPERYLAEIDDELLSPLATMAGQLPRLKRCLVELPTNTFDVLLERAERAKSNIVKRRLRSQDEFEWDIGKTKDSESDVLADHHSIWIQGGVESDLAFDYLGKPFSMSARMHVLL